MDKKLIRLTESDLHRIIKESVNRIIEEQEGFRDGFKSGYGHGALQNWNNGEYSEDIPSHGEWYNDKNDPTRTKGKAIKNRIGMALGSIAGGKMPRGTFKRMDLNKG